YADVPPRPTRRSSDLGLVAQAVQRVLDAIEKPCMISGREYLITCSIGVSLYPEDGGDPDVLLKNADLAMYKAKESGRNAFWFFRSEEHTAELQSRENL